MPHDAAAIRAAAERLLAEHGRDDVFHYGHPMNTPMPCDIQLVATSALAMIEALEAIAEGGWVYGTHGGDQSCRNCGVWRGEPHESVCPRGQALAALAAGRPEQEPADGR